MVDEDETGEEDDEEDDEDEEATVVDEAGAEEEVGVWLDAFDEDTTVFPPQADSPKSKAADEMRTNFSFFMNIFSFLKWNCCLESDDEISRSAQLDLVGLHSFGCCIGN